MSNHETRFVIDSEIADELRRIASILYPNMNYGPSMSQWNMLRATGNPKSNTLMDRMFGRNTQRNQTGWTAFLALLSLEHPPRFEIQAANRRYAEQFAGLFDRVPKLGEEKVSTAREGLPVIPIQRTILRWCYQRHAYIPAETISAFLAR